MIFREPYQMTGDRQRIQRKAVLLEWLTIFFLLTIVVVMYLAMGNSQAMRTAWIEDLLSLIPPTLFLISVRVNKWRPNERHPYGYHRISTAAFMGASLAVVLLAGYLLIESLIGLFKQEHPTIGMVTLAGYHVWLGWVMIAALIYSAIPPVILGHLKLNPGRELHEKTLVADALMNKADWMTAVAGIGGIIGVGYGFWWADGAAAAVIATDVLKDGVRQFGRSLHDLMDQRPTETDRATPSEITVKLRDALQQLAWVQAAGVRLRDEGALVAGEAYLVMVDETDLLARLDEARQVASDVDWRIYDIVVVPVRELPQINANQSEA